MSSGERPIGAAKGKQSDTEALCRPPPPGNGNPWPAQSAQPSHGVGQRPCSWGMLFGRCARAVPALCGNALLTLIPGVCKGVLTGVANAVTGGRVGVGWGSKVCVRRI